MYRTLMVPAALLLPSSMVAQRLGPVPAYAASTLPPPSAVPRVNNLLTGAAIPRTYWLEGGTIGGIGPWVLGAPWFWGKSEVPTPPRATITGGALFGAVGFTPS